MMKPLMSCLKIIRERRCLLIMSYIVRLSLAAVRCYICYVHLFAYYSFLTGVCLIIMLDGVNCVINVTVVNDLCKDVFFTS